MKGDIIRACAPLRIGIAGGGTDVDPYASAKGGLVLNATINKYAYCTIRANGTDNMSVNSLDYGKYEADVSGGPLNYDGNMDLAKVVRNYFDVKEGFDMFLHSDAPPGSGLGGSSTVIVTIIKAMSDWLNLNMTKQEIAALAYSLERKTLGLKGGKQDQYAAAFGGFNLMEFYSDRVKVNPVDIKQSTIDELQYCSLMCYTGKSRESADIIESQVKGFKEGSNEAALDATKVLAMDITHALEHGNVVEAGQLLKDAWEQKKKFSTKITNPLIDDLYNAAIESGAYGGKASGAGGGGFMFFICQYDKKHLVAKELKKRGAIMADLSFENRGARSWRP